MATLLSRQIQHEGPRLFYLTTTSVPDLQKPVGQGTGIWVDDNASTRVRRGNVTLNPAVPGLRWPMSSSKVFLIKVPSSLGL